LRRARGSSRERHDGCHRDAEFDVRAGRSECGSDRVRLRKNDSDLPRRLRRSVDQRSIIAELYQLDTEIGPRYYTNVVGPEFRAASRACFAAHSIKDLPDAHSKLEEEIEANVRRRVVGKHIEIASVTFEGVTLPQK
jgi:hypothetical protein